MIWKFIPLTILAGITACGLLAFRQGRIDAAHDMLQLQEDLRVNERLLLDLRTELRSNLDLDRVRAMCKHLAEHNDVSLVPIRLDECVSTYDEFVAARIEIDESAENQDQNQHSNGL